MQAKSATPPLAVPQRPKESSFALPPPITCKTHGTVLDGDAACDLFPLLRTVSGVVIMPCSWWQCEGLHFDDELGAEMVGDRPVHDSPGVHVQDSSAIHPPFGSAVLGDVGEPQPVGPVGVEPSLHAVLPDRGAGLVIPPAAPMHPLQAGDSHQPRHPLMRHSQLPAESQLGAAAAHTVSAPRAGMDIAEGMDQVRILKVSERRAAMPPFVEAGGGDL